MFDRIKKEANIAKFKAEQMMRVQGVQNEIATINQQVNGVKDRIAGKVLELRQNGPLGLPEIDELCATIEGLQAQIAQKEAHVNAIRAEQPPQSGAPAPQQAYPPQPGYPPPPPAAPAAKICPNCQTNVPAPAMFCTSCGYNFQQAPVAPVPPVATQTCPNCNYEVPAASAFCPNCGQGLAH
jgi:RNA polymerase subunit RPABC4/transcription elongation factor Spt4